MIGPISRIQLPLDGWMARERGSGPVRGHRRREDGLRSAGSARCRTRSPRREHDRARGSERRDHPGVPDEPREGRWVLRGPSAAAPHDARSEDRCGANDTARLPCRRRAVRHLRDQGRGAHQPRLVLQRLGQPRRHDRGGRPAVAGEGTRDHRARTERAVRSAGRAVAGVRGVPEEDVADDPRDRAGAVRPGRDRMNTGRLEAFADGVFAIAATLLILSVDGHFGSCAPAGATLARQLVCSWPSYVAYIVSFLTIGIIWVNHHTVMDQINHPDRTVLMIPVALLMIGALIPSPTPL